MSVLSVSLPLPRLPLSVHLWLLLASLVGVGAGVPACSTPVLKSLAGKAGKARKKLAELGLLDHPAEGE